MSNDNNECTRESLGDYVLVRLKGEVDLSWSQQVRKAILEALVESQELLSDSIVYMTKPFDWNALLETVEQLTGRPPTKPARSTRT